MKSFDYYLREKEIEEPEQRIILQKGLPNFLVKGARNGFLLGALVTITGKVGDFLAGDFEWFGWWDFLFVLCFCSVSIAILFAVINLISFLIYRKNHRKLNEMDETLSQQP